MDTFGTRCAQLCATKASGIPNIGKPKASTSGKAPNRVYKAKYPSGFVFAITEGGSQSTPKIIGRPGDPKPKAKASKE